MRTLSSIAFLGLVLLFLSGTAAAQTSNPQREARRTPVVQVFEQSRDAVVNISASSVIEVRTPFDDVFQFFEGRSPTRRYTTTSVGSGFLIHSAGYIVTNAHVVARTTERKVIFADKREFPAQVVAVDQERDLAVLKISANQPLPALPLGRSNDLMVGETVVAIGNPLGYQHSCTTGIVSAIDREIQVDDNSSFKGLIQTDASINPGNSGGPLLNILGRLIGVNTAIRGDAQNIGFAIPVDQLRSVLPEMIDVERRYGIVTGMEVEEVAVGGVTRCRIQSVLPNSPAHKAGLGYEPVLLESLDGDNISTALDYVISLVGKQPGQTVALVVRNSRNEASVLRMTLAARPKPDGAKIMAQRFGLTAEKLSERMAKAMNMTGLSALLVTDVERGGPAERIGVKRGDVIMQIGRHPIGSLEEIGEMLEKIQPGQPVAITVLRVQGAMIIRSTANLRAR